MLKSSTRDILNRRPHIKFIAPRAEDTIPEPSPDKIAPTTSEQVDQLIAGFNNVEKTAELVEELIAERAKDVVVKLDLTNPEDFATAQAAARIFPEKATEAAPGVMLVKEITFPMYRQCVQEMKEHGKERGKANQIPSIAPSPTKTDFGGQGKDRRPELNQMSVPMVPIDILAYIVATIPLLFGMLYPLTALYVKSSILGHTHVPPIGGPGVPVTP